MRTKENQMAKMIAVIIVMILPITGLILIDLSTTMGENYFWFGVVLIMLFPLIISANILRYKTKM